MGAGPVKPPITPFMVFIFFSLEKSVRTRQTAGRLEGWSRASPEWSVGSTRVRLFNPEGSPGVQPGLRGERRGTGEAER